MSQEHHHSMLDVQYAVRYIMLRNYSCGYHASHRSAPLLPVVVGIKAFALTISLALLVVGHKTNGVSATTCVAIQYDHGIVMGADTRSIASGHSYVSHTHNMDHIVPINAEVVMARTGNSARTLHLAQQLQRDQHWQFLRYNRILTVSQLASRVQNIMYHDDLSQQQQQQQESPLVEIIVAGIDRHTHKCHIYTISPSGAIIHHQQQQPQQQRFGFATCGSGSTYITGYLQQEQMDQTTTTTTTGLTETDAIGICRRAMEMALQHDASSGGDICLTTISTSSSTTAATQKSTQDTTENYCETTTSNLSTNRRPRIQQRHYTIHRPMRH